MRVAATTIYGAVTDGPEPRPPRVVELPGGLRYCRHGREVERVTAEESFGGWMIWGHYACDQCERVAFHYMAERPDDARIGTKWLPVTRE